MSFLSPIGYSDYGFPSVGWGWQAPFFTPPSLYSYADPSSFFSSSFGGRYSFGSLFSPVYGGVPFMPSYGDRYEYDLMDAGARLLTWGNIVEGDPFYRAAYYPWLFGSYVPPLPFYPSYNLFSDNSAPAAQAPAAQGAQGTEAGQGNGGPEGAAHAGNRNDPATERVNETIRLLEEQNNQLRKIIEQQAGAGHGQRSENTGTTRTSTGQRGEIDPTQVRGNRR